MSSSQSRQRLWPSCALGGVVVLLAGLLWHGLSAPRAAYGQIPDSGAQLNEMIVQLRTSNQKLTEIIELLREIRDTQVSEKAAQKEKTPRPPARR